MCSYGVKPSAHYDFCHLIVKNSFRQERIGNVELLSAKIAERFVETQGIYKIRKKLSFLELSKVTC